MRHLKLQRPLIGLDLETTGTNPRLDRIVEIAAVKIHPDGRRETWKKRVNPQRPIPAGATAIHGIRDEDVASAPTFAEIAFDFLRFLGGSDLAGFGLIKFDVPMLAEEFRRVNLAWNATDAKIVDVQRIYHMREPRTLSAALRFYCSREHVGAHGAEADVLATLDVLEGQLERYPDLARDVEALGQLCEPGQGDDKIDPLGRLKWQDGEVAVAFGQKSGMTLRDLVAKEPSYLRWMLNKDFSPEVKQHVRNALDGKFTRRGSPAPGAPQQEELPL